MAVNDYYQSSNPNTQNHEHTSYHEPGSAIGGTEHGRTNASLPPTPANHLQSSYNKPVVDTSYHAHPVSSPFDDNQYPTYPRPAQPDAGRQSPHYYGKPSSPGYSSYHDPFNDSNAIPLQNQAKHDNQYGGMASPTQGMGHAEQYGSQPPTRPSRRKKEQGWFKGKITWGCYILFLIQIAVFIAELVRNGILTGTPIAIKPSFNPMIGPSPYVLINMGARYPPCMKNVNVRYKNSDELGPLISQPDISIQCPNTTSADANCHLADLCGSGMNLTPNAAGAVPAPNQWWRFITPIFLHAGIIHIAFNMLIQLTLGRDVELLIGTIRFVLIYFCAGIFANVFSGNFAPNGQPSTGASGALFAIIAMLLLDLLYTWKSRVSPVKELLFIMLDIVIAFVIGLLPGLDNFAHIGGFLVGIMLGISLMRSPDTLRERIGLDDPKYGALPHITEDPLEKNSGLAGLKTFAKSPVGFFKGRKPLWWGWWLLRAAFLVIFIVVFIVLINNFYQYRQTCKWCKYLSCLVCSPCTFV